MRHLRALGIALHVVKGFLNLDKALRHLAQHRLDDGGEKPLLVAEADIDGVGARLRRGGNGAQGGVGVAFVQEFFLCAEQYPLRYALNLLCHQCASIHNTVS